MQPACHCCASPPPSSNTLAIQHVEGGEDRVVAGVDHGLDGIAAGNDDLQYGGKSGREMQGCLWIKLVGDSDRVAAEFARKQSLEAHQPTAAAIFDACRSRSSSAAVPGSCFTLCSVSVWGPRSTISNCAPTLHQQRGLDARHAAAARNAECSCLGKPQGTVHICDAACTACLCCLERQASETASPLGHVPHRLAKSL